MSAAETDERARVVEAHQGQVAAVARRFLSSGVELVDLLQEGSLALLEAYGRFEPERGVPFWAYAAPWVHGAISCCAHDQRHPVRLPAAARVELTLLHRASQHLARAHGREPPVSAVADQVGIPRRRAEQLVAAGRLPRSLHEPLGRDADGAAGIDAVPDPAAEEPFERALENADAPDPRLLLGVLSPREREVIARRFGLGRPEETLASVGDDLGVTRERVRQIEVCALGKLREAAAC